MKNPRFLTVASFAASTYLATGTLRGEFKATKRNEEVVFWKRELHGSIVHDADDGEAIESLAPIGGDVDEHGCIPSAGYSWCRSTETCERPFETACYDCDENGCLTFAGYAWCPVTGKCQSKLYTNCTGLWEVGVGGVSYDSNGCCIECGQEWCEANNTCIDSSLYSCPFECTNVDRKEEPSLLEYPAVGVVGGAYDEHGCCESCGESWCDSSQSCIRIWETACFDCDEHGCLTTAGYSWCPTTGQCQNTLYTNCTGHWKCGIVNCTVDEYGCGTESGDTWCEANNTCIDVNVYPCPYRCENSTRDNGENEEDQTEESAVVVGGDYDERGCCMSCGESWCASSQSCVQTFETACYDCDEHGCLITAGYSWCPTTGQCQNTLYTNCTDHWECGIANCTVDEYGCGTFSGDTWCEANSTCVNADMYSCPYQCQNFNVSGSNDP